MPLAPQRKCAQTSHPAGCVSAEIIRAASNSSMANSRSEPLRRALAPSRQMRAVDNPSRAKQAAQPFCLGCVQRSASSRIRQPSAFKTNRELVAAYRLGTTSGSGVGLAVGRPHGGLVATLASTAARALNGNLMSMSSSLSLSVIGFHLHRHYSAGVQRSTACLSDCWQRGGGARPTTWSIFGCTCYHPLFVFNPVRRSESVACPCACGPDVHSAHEWRDVLDPVVARYLEQDTPALFPW